MLQTDSYVTKFPKSYYKEIFSSNINTWTYIGTEFEVTFHIIHSITIIISSEIRHILPLPSSELNLTIKTLLPFVIVNQLSNSNTELDGKDHQCIGISEYRQETCFNLLHSMLDGILVHAAKNPGSKSQIEQ